MHQHKTIHAVYAPATQKLWLYCSCGTAPTLMEMSEETASTRADQEGWRYYEGSSLEEWYARPRLVGFDYGD